MCKQFKESEYSMRFYARLLVCILAADSAAIVGTTIIPYAGFVTILYNQTMLRKAAPEESGSSETVKPRFQYSILIPVKISRNEHSLPRKLADATYLPAELFNAELFNTDDSTITVTENNKQFFLTVKNPPAKNRDKFHLMYLATRIGNMNSPKPKAALPKPAAKPLQTTRKPRQYYKPAATTPSSIPGPLSAIQRLLLLEASYGSQPTYTQSELPESELPDLFPYFSTQTNPEYNYSD